jgi:hemolysin III
MTHEPGTSSSFLGRYLREPVNSLSHFAGVLLSIAALVVLLLLSEGEPWRLTSFSVYGASAILLYSASTLLHGLKVKGRVHHWLRRVDHAAIFIFIAGCYTPITLISLRGDYTTLSWLLFGFIWAVALAGMLFKLVWFRLPRWISTGAYLLLAWLAVTAFVPLFNTLSLGGMIWLLAGGLFYSVGAVIYAVKKPDLLPGLFGYHELWHFFVLAGSTCHFFMLLFYVLPR